MASMSQRKASNMHRHRSAVRGLVRVEVRAAKSDASLIQALAETLRGKSEKADLLRSTLEEALFEPEVKTAFDIFGADLSDEVFSSVFDQPRERGWDEADL